MFFEHGVSRKAMVALEANGFVKVSVPTTSRWTPGQHFFVRFRSMGMHSMTSHPFSACSFYDDQRTNETIDSDLTFLIRPRGGFTSRLARWAESNPGGALRVMLDGPYGGIDVPKFASARRLLLVAGGSGAGWLLPLVELYLRQSSLEQSIATGSGEKAQHPAGAKAKVILATRDNAIRAWFEHAVSDLVSSYDTCRQSGLTLEIFFTGIEERSSQAISSGQFLQELRDPEACVDSQLPEQQRASNELTSPGSTNSFVRQLFGRPDLCNIVRQELVVDQESLGVYVCGPLGMQHVVANEMAQRQLKIFREGSGNAYLHREHFAWA